MWKLRNMYGVRLSDPLADSYVTAWRTTTVCSLFCRLTIIDRCIANNASKISFWCNLLRSCNG